MAHSVTFVPGDGAGPQRFEAVRDILSAAGVAIDWDVQAPADGLLTPELLASARQTQVVLAGYQTVKSESGLPVIVQLRKQLGVFVDLRPIRTRRGVPSRFENVDILLVRESTEDIYAHLEHESIPGVFESMKITTYAACARIARYAFETARRKGRKKVTIVHKANILKKADGLFLRTGLEVAKDYPDIAVDDCIVDALTMKLVLDPTRFDVLLCGNLFGDIVGDLGAGIVGGPVSSPSLGESEDGLRLYAAARGETNAAEGCANPMVLLHPALYMLNHLDERDASERIRQAAEQTLVDQVLPVGMGGDATCADFRDAVIERLG